MNFSIEIDSANRKVVADLRQTINRENKEFVRAIGKTLYEEAKEITGKKYFSTYQLRKLGFPYSTRYKENYLMDDRVINLQSGTLHNSLRWGVWFTKDGARTKLWSNCPYVSSLVSGTSKNRPRKFMELAYERTMKKLPTLEEKFLKKVK